MSKSQPLFNIFENVISKTQSRATAEWSVCSTINYLMTVATTHFFECETNDSSVQHPLKRDLTIEEVVLWDLCEKYYSIMHATPEEISNNNIPQKKLTPVFPSLITSTDKMSFFATNSVVNGKHKTFI